MNKYGNIINKRIMTTEEFKYADRQGPQIAVQTGFIGCLKGSLGFDIEKTGNRKFRFKWVGTCRILRTKEFKNELNEIINRERSENSPLFSRRALSEFCFNNMDAAMDEFKQDFGYRIDTSEYSYLIKSNPYNGKFSMYCYRRLPLNQHIQNAREGILFIDSAYRKKFVLSDGGKIRVIIDNIYKVDDRICRYINQEYLEVDGISYHICEFADKMEHLGATVVPHLYNDICRGGIKTERILSLA